jgi:hypothetical protein
VWFILLLVMRQNITWKTTFSRKEVLWIGFGGHIRFSCQTLDESAT